MSKHIQSVETKNQIRHVLNIFVLFLIFGLFFHLYFRSRRYSILNHQEHITTAYSWYLYGSEGWLEYMV